MMQNKRLLNVFSCVLTMILNSEIQAQKPISYTKPVFGRGIGFASQDSLFTLALSGRIQSMAEIKHDLNNEKTGADFFVRRCRLNIQGTAYHPSFTYRIQLGFTQRDITAENSMSQNNLNLRDAMLFYSPVKWLKLGFGQTKLPGNRQRQISSANLQLVERSIVNNNFTLDRDKGIWVYTNFNIGTMGIKATASLSSGEGRINSDKNGELCYSGRMELYPLGFFTGINDYIESDQEKEKTPKIAIAGAYSYNSANNRTLGQLGEYLFNNVHSNVRYYGGDLIFKYRGFSLEAEMYTRNADIGIVVNNLDSTQFNFILSGSGMMVQTGIFIGKKSEFAFRAARINPSNRISSIYKVQEEYVFGYSRYFSKHSLKLQSDCTYFKNGNKESLVYRLSGVVTF